MQPQRPAQRRTSCAKSTCQPHKSSAKQRTTTHRIRSPDQSAMLKPFPRKFIAAHPFRHAPQRSTTLTLVALACVLVLLFLHGTSVYGGARAPRRESTLDVLTAWRDADYARERLAIYVYELPAKYNRDLVQKSRTQPPTIRDPYCDTNFYSSEVHVHEFLLSSAVRTMDAQRADFFYVPIYTTCDLITTQPNDVARVGANFDAAMRHVIEQMPYFNRSNGRDHVFLFAQGFSARLAGDWAKYKNGIFMVHNGEFTAPEYTPHKDFTIAPELRAYLRPVWPQLGANGSSVEKRYLAQFGGQVVNAKVSDHRGSNYSGGVRQYIQAHLTRNSAYRITGVRSKTYLDDMRQSIFCLAPEGWHPWSPRPYYSVLMGCIPVVISEVQELAFEEMVAWGEFAVWIRPRDIAQLDTILRSISKDEIERRMALMRQIWRVFWYERDGLGNQAILHSLYRRKYSSKPRRVFSSVA